MPTLEPFVHTSTTSWNPGKIAICALSAAHSEASSSIAILQTMAHRIQVESKTLLPTGCTIKSVMMATERLSELTKILTDFRDAFCELWARSDVSLQGTRDALARIQVNQLPRPPLAVGSNPPPLVFAIEEEGKKDNVDDEEKKDMNDDHNNCWGATDTDNECDGNDNNFEVDDADSNFENERDASKSEDASNAHSNQHPLWYIGEVSVFNNLLRRTTKRTSAAETKPASKKSRT
ncbi:hypothetical protein HK405_007186, partial [Cladochytrium tenue]